MVVFSLVTNRKRKWLTGLLCLMGHIRWWCRRIFCPRAKPPPLIQAPTATIALHPTATRSAVPHSLPLTGSLMLFPFVLPDLLSRLLFAPLLRTRRRRTLAIHARPQDPKQADPLWMQSSLPSYSSSSGTTLQALEPSAEKMLLWVSSTYSHKINLSPFCSSWTTRTVNAQLWDQMGPDQLTALVPFRHQGAN